MILPPVSLLGQAVNPWLYYAVALAFIFCGSLCWLSNAFSLPGNWLLLGLTALFAWWAPEAAGRGVSWSVVGILAGLALLGELIEFTAGAAGAAKQGASRRSVLLSLAGGLAGSIAGAVAGLPIPLIGSIAGAVLGGAAGSFAGAYLGESWKQRPHGQGVAVATAAFKGRIWGTLGKFAVGAVMLGVAAVDVLFV
jgi:uncharacterized protein YqgC (DUF456 family)